MATKLRGCGVTINKNACLGSDPGQAQINAIDGARVAHVPTSCTEAEAVFSTISKQDGQHELSPISRDFDIRNADHRLAVALEHGSCRYLADALWRHPIFETLSADLRILIRRLADGDLPSVTYMSRLSDLALSIIVRRLGEST